MTSRSRTRALTALTFVIVFLCMAAFAWTQIQKQEEAPIAGIRFDGRLAPGCDCPRETAKLSFTLDRAQPITATIVDEDERSVRTLLDSALRASGRATLTWDGTDDRGRVVPDGDYRLRVDLAVPDRTITIPSDIEVRGGGGRSESAGAGPDDSPGAGSGHSPGAGSGESAGAG